MRKVIKSLGIFNIFTALIIGILWSCVFFVQGLFGAVSWGLLKMYLPFAGLLGLIVSILIVIILSIKKKRIFRGAISLALCTVLLFPILLTLNVIKFAYPASINKTNPSVTIVWPIKEKSVVGWGGDTVESNLPHVIWASERWAYDILIEPYNSDSPVLEDYGIWNVEVISPVSGVVVAAFDDEDDIMPNTEDFISTEGNHVYIKIEETGTYLLLNHLKKDSVTVKVGEHVNPGDLIGFVGNSGSTSEPHLHIHHQRQDPTKALMPIFAEGLPLYFRDIDGKPMPEKGDILVPHTK
ncbi:M23 family metallopeptidase [Paenibacillus sp. NPDC058177]|uniref:M23 family metallopeptidase n=1 Tax=Paenibacillus sp. NPDC058177 TaxID=3346369 RepID=UPI0036DA632D